jgi:NaMN:DMB phosphoribosyltransferase
MLRSVARFGAVCRYASAGQKVYVVGVGMTKFEKPGSRKNFDYPDMSKEAVERAMEDAGRSIVKIWGKWGKKWVKN